MSISQNVIRQADCGLAPGPSLASVQHAEPSASPIIRGRHVVATMYGVPFDVLNNTELLWTALTDAVLAAGATIMTGAAHHFTPFGVTGLVLGESHASIHTWPQRGIAMVDFFTCGPVADPQVALAYLQQVLAPTHIESAMMIRDVVDAPFSAPRPAPQTAVFHVAPA